MKYKYNGQWVEVSIKALDSMPIGSIILFAGEEDSIPTGWMICDGRVVAKEGLEELYDVIGAIYGTPPSNSEFYLPDLRGKVPVGMKSTDTDFSIMGTTGGEKTHTLTIEQIPSHKHNVPYIDSISPQGGGSDPNYGLVKKAWTQESGYTGGGQAHNNLQPYLVVNYIIKAKNTTPTMASIVNSYSTSTQDGYSCNYINDNCGEVVWVNTIGNPFPSTSTSVDLSAYKWFKVYYFLDNHRTNLKTITCNLGDSILIDEGSLQRTIEISSTKLYIHSGYYQGGRNNDAIIPSHIIGYK